MMEHTKEPWRVELSWITGSDGKRITCPTACMSRDDDENEANERRIVACVNACAGIPTEGLENSGFSSDILLKIATLKQQCDELKKALQWYADRFSNENGKPTVAQKAIAKWEKPNAIAQGREPHNAPHEGRTAALSPGVPLDAVVGPLGEL